MLSDNIVDSKRMASYYIWERMKVILNYVRYFLEVIFGGPGNERKGNIHFQDLESTVKTL